MESMRARRWWARGALALVVLAFVVLLAFAGRRGLWLVVLTGAMAAVVVVALFWFLLQRGPLRWLALGRLLPGTLPRNSGIMSSGDVYSVCLGERVGTTKEPVKIFPRQKLSVHDDRPNSGSATDIGERIGVEPVPLHLRS